jgi:hypothetical protein
MPGLGDVVFAPVDAAEWPGAAKVLQGLAVADEDREWREGDSLLFGVRFRHGSEVRRWLVQLHTSRALASRRFDYTVTSADGDVETSSSRVAMVQFTVFEADGALALHDGTARIPIISVPRDAFDQGPAGLGLLGMRWQGSRLVQPDGSLRDPTSVERAEHSRRFFAAYTGVRHFLDTLADEPTLSPYFWRVVEKPMGAVLLALGRIRLVVQCGNAVPNPGGLPAPLASWAPSPSFVWPIDVHVNGVHVLRAQVLAVPSAPPLSLAAGIVAASAVHPGDPDRRVDVVLLASRRAGPGGAPGLTPLPQAGREADPGVAAPAPARNAGSL